MLQTPDATLPTPFSDELLQRLADEPAPARPLNERIRTAWQAAWAPSRGENASVLYNALGVSAVVQLAAVTAFLLHAAWSVTVEIRPVAPTASSPPPNAIVVSFEEKKEEPPPEAKPPVKEQAAAEDSKPQVAENTRPRRARKHTRRSRARRLRSTAPDPDKTAEAAPARKLVAGDTLPEAAEGADRGQVGQADGSPDGTADADAPSVEPAKKKVDKRRLLARYLKRLARSVRKRYAYPRAARRLRLEGQVVVAITVGCSGEVLEVQLATTSGHDTLDDAALAAARSINRLPQPPEELDWTRKVVRVPFKYRLDS